MSLPPNFSVHIVIEEKIVVSAGRDGGLQNMEVHGMCKVKVNDSDYGRIRVQMHNNDKKGIQMQVGLQTVQMFNVLI